MKPIKLIGTGPLMVVDDNSDDLEIAKRALRYSKVQNTPLLLQSGKACLDYMNRVESKLEALPCLILIDINMPIMTGHEVVEILRKQDNYRTSPPIIVLTASNDETDYKKSLACGADDHRVKPFGFDDHIAFLNSLL